MRAIQSGGRCVRRGRLLRQLFTETIVLALIGGALAVTVVKLGLPGLLNLAPQALPALRGVQINFAVLLFAITVSLITGVLCALLPALQATRLELSSVINEGSLRISSGGVGRWFRNVLAVAQIALSMVLLIGAGMMIRTFMQMQSGKLGFNTDNVMTMRIATTGNQYTESFRAATFFQQLIDRLKTIPGTEAIGVTNVLPLSGEFGNSFKIEGGPRPPGEVRDAEYRAISPDYFRAMGIPLQKGRVFTERDAKDAPGVAMINEEFARRYFPNEDPLGKRLHIDTQVELATYGGKTIPREIVGVVAQVKNSVSQSRSKPEMYVPYLQNPHRVMTVVMRNSSDPAILANTVRNAKANLESVVKK